MSFYCIITTVSVINTIICFVLLYINKQEYLKNIGNKEVTIARLNRENNRLQRIIENNKYDINKDYEIINYISDDKYGLYTADGMVYVSAGYTDDISKAKNFVKINTAYYEIGRKDN